MMHELLLEIGLEEIPARFIQDSEKQLKERMTDFLTVNRLDFSEIKSYSTPRRLAVVVKGLDEKQEDLSEEIRGPAKGIAQDERGQWTKAAEGFVRGQGCDLSDAFFKEDKDEEHLFVVKNTVGQAASEVLKDLDQVVARLTFPVTMRWADYDFEYIRPIHWIVALLDDQVIPFQILNIESGKRLDGHRFLGEELELESVDDYKKKLEKQYVIVDREKRQDMIVQQLEELEKEEGFSIDSNPELLEEVTDMVEYPTAFFGSYKEDFLKLPVEVLTTTMSDHQRYFSVSDSKGDLLPYFVSVRNGTKDYIENVVRGNEKVIQARLQDALFFYEEDLKIPLEDYVEKLDHISFYQGLGSMSQKIERVQVIAQIIGDQVGVKAEELKDLDRAAQLSKFDLSTLMVNEFSELQGVMGSYYAKEAGEKDSICLAIREHYMPNSAQGDLPQSDIGAVLAISDKLDSVMMFFAAGQIPTGSNDPFGLRRQAYGILRILLDKQWNLYMLDLVDQILAEIPYPSQEVEANIYQQKQAILNFIKNRIRQYLEMTSTKTDIIDAILASKQDNMRNLVQNAELLMEKRDQANYQDLIENLSRVVNLREKALELLPPDYVIDESAFETSSEEKLYEEVQELSQNIDKSTDAETVYQSFEKLSPIIQDFFDENLVMHEEDKKRFNRLQILLNLSAVIISFAHVSKLIKK